MLEKEGTRFFLLHLSKRLSFLSTSFLHKLKGKSQLFKTKFAKTDGRFCSLSNTSDDSLKNNRTVKIHAQYLISVVFSSKTQHSTDMEYTTRASINTQQSYNNHLTDSLYPIPVAKNKDKKILFFPNQLPSKLNRYQIKKNRFSYLPIDSSSGGCSSTGMMVEDPSILSMDETKQTAASKESNGISQYPQLSLCSSLELPQVKQMTTASTHKSGIRFDPRTLVQETSLLVSVAFWKFQLLELFHYPSASPWSLPYSLDMTKTFLCLPYIASEVFSLGGKIGERPLLVITVTDEAVYGLLSVSSITLLEVSSMEKD